LSRFYWWHNTKMKVSTVNNVIYFWFLSNLKPLQKTYKFKKISSRTWTLTWSWAQWTWTWLLSDLLPVWLQSFHVIMCKGTNIQTNSTTNKRVFTTYIMLLIAVSCTRCGRDLQAKLYTSLSANHAYLKTSYTVAPFRVMCTVWVSAATYPRVT